MLVKVSNGYNAESSYLFLASSLKQRGLKVCASHIRATIDALPFSSNVVRRGSVFNHQNGIRYIAGLGSMPCMIDQLTSRASCVSTQHVHIAIPPPDALTPLPNCLRLRVSRWQAPLHCMNLSIESSTAQRRFVGNLTIYVSKGRNVWKDLQTMLTLLHLTQWPLFTALAVERRECSRLRRPPSPSTAA